MAEVINVINNDTLPIPIDERFGVYLMKKNGVCAKYEYKDVRGKVTADGQYSVMLAGKEYLLQDGLGCPKTEWKQIVYHDILEFVDYSMFKKVCNKQLNSRDLTRVIKHRLVFLEEKDNKTIAMKFDGKYIMDKLESNMQCLYEDEFWKRWYDRYILKNKTRLKIKLAVYDTEFEISIDKKDIEKFYYSSRLVTERLNAYTHAHKNSKTEHEIALMTMLDLALLSIRKESNESK